MGKSNVKIYWNSYVVNCAHVFIPSHPTWRVPCATASLLNNFLFRIPTQIYIHNSISNAYNHMRYPTHSFVVTIALNLFCIFVDSLTRSLAHHHVHVLLNGRLWPQVKCHCTRFNFKWFRVDNNATQRAVYCYWMEFPSHESDAQSFGHIRILLWLRHNKPTLFWFVFPSFFICLSKCLAMKRNLRMFSSSKLLKSVKFTNEMCSLFNYLWEDDEKRMLKIR